MRTLNRRQFMKQSLTTATAVAAVHPARLFGANEKIVVAVMGVGGRGSFLAQRFAERPDVELAYVCDADLRRAERAKGSLEKDSPQRPEAVQDFRRVLDDKRVEVLVNATPDHWHALGTILACQAGKDVYVEKPACHNLWEGRKMIEAARKYHRVVQVGMQSRSAPYAQAAREYIQAGQLGDVHLVRVHNQMQHPLAPLGSEQPVPTGLDYDLWCGPAAKLPYVSNRAWLNFAEYSCGPIPGDLVHQIDLARYLMGDPPPPKTVSHSGGILALKDGRDLPDTQLATYEFERFTLLAQSSLWTPYLKKIPQQVRDNDLFPDWPFCATKVEVLGTKQFMYFGRHGGGWQVLDADDKVVAQCYGRQADKAHIENFLQCVRTRSRPIADIEQGHLSAGLCHLANAAWRAGNRQLAFDATTESFAEPAANAFLRRTSYRPPWIVAEKV